MAEQLQLRRGTTAEHAVFTGAVGEATVDTDKDVIVVHDGTTVGGFPLAKQSDVALKAVDAEVVKLTGDQSVAGIKTFTSIPVVPATSPTTDNQVTRKKYVDDGLALKTGIGTATPLAPAVTAVVGTSTNASRQDHVHPTNFTATATDIKMNGTQAVGSLVTFARADHVHPSDTSKADLTLINWRDTMMSKAEFNAIATERRANRAGSGFDEFGKHHVATVTYPNVNEGLWTGVGTNTFILGFPEGNTSNAGVSKTFTPRVSVNGIFNNISYCNSSADTRNNILLPPAPTVLPSTATLTQQQIDSGVIKHADVSNSGLILNGKFDTDTSGWVVAGGTLTWEAGRAKHTVVSNTYYYQGFTCVIGKKYIVEFVVEGATTPYITTNGASTGSILNMGYVIRVGAREQYEFIATATTMYFSLYSIGTVTTYLDNIAVFPADAISRQEFVFLKKNTVNVATNDFVYPLGNKQFLGTTGDAGTTVAGSFAGATTYSLFSSLWQTPSALVGKGYVWGTLSDANKKAFVANPENNCYLDGADIYQAQYIAQVAMMKGDTFTESTAFASLGYTQDTVDKGLWKHTDGSETISIDLVHRRNQGFTHPVYNPNGTKLASDSLPWYSTTVSFTSIADCFTESKLLATSGYIGTTTGRADGIFYDQIHEGDITDLRMSSKVPTDYNRLIDKEFNRLVAGTYRGTEGEWNYTTEDIITSVSNSILAQAGGNSIVFNIVQFPNIVAKASVGDIIIAQSSTDNTGGVFEVYLWSSTYIACRYVKFDNTWWYTVSDSYRKNTHAVRAQLIKKSTRTKSNTLTHTDIIGSPANYPTAWKQSGIFGTPLIVAEDGTSLLPTGTTGSDGLATFKLSRKANATPLQVLKSADSGATWTALTVTTHYTFSTTTNAITFTAGNIPLVAHLVMVVYATHASMATPTVNSEVLAIGDGFATSFDSDKALLYSFIGKVGINAGVAGAKVFDRFKLTHSALNTSNLLQNNNAYGDNTHGAVSMASLSTPTVKVFPYLTRSNGKAWLVLVFKEMKYTTSWGDDSKFNIVDNVSTTTDNNAQTVLIGQKRIELPYFIGASE